MKQDENDPQHYHFKAMFGTFTWWQQSDNLRFVIIARYGDNEGNIEKMDLLFKDTESITQVEYVDIINKYKRGELKRTSVSGN